MPTISEEGQIASVLIDSTGKRLDIGPIADGEFLKRDGDDIVSDVGGGGDTLPIVDTTAVVKGSADATKLVRIEADGLATGTTRVLTMPDADITPDDASASRAPSGSASGGLAGTYPGPTVNGLTSGVLTDDAAHGVRGGGTQHANTVAAGASGFMTGADKTKLDGIEALADVTDEANVAAAHPLVDTTALVKGSADATKQARLEVDGLTTSTTRIITVPDKDITLDDSGDPRTDDAAIHDNVAAEISAVAEKVTPVSADLVLIEDSADSNNKKKVQVGNLPSGGGDTLPIVDTTAVVKGSVDATKLVRIEADGLTTATTRVLTMPDADITPDDASASRPPSGAASGGLGGTYPGPTVDGMTSGVLTDDTAHGARGGGTQHANVVAAGAAGFMTGADKTKLNGIETLADVTDEANVTTSFPISDATSLVKDPADATKQVRIDAGTVATATTRVITMPDQDVALIDTGDSRLSDERTANAIATTGADVNVDASSPPTTGQILKATTATTATWQTEASGGSAVTVEDEGTPLTTDVTKMNFAGAGVTVTEPVADEVLITIPGAGAIRDTWRFQLNGKPTSSNTLDGAWIAPRAGNFTRATLYRRTAGSGGSLIVDINKNGTTIYTTQGNRPTITAASGNDQIDATTDFDVTAFAQDDRIEFDIDATESGNSADISMIIEVSYDT